MTTTKPNHAKQGSTTTRPPLLITLSIFATITLLTIPTHAEPAAPTQTELDNIVANCATIKQSLTQLQRADSRTRIYLGAAYETISSNFITPLSIRLVKNNLTATDLFNIQSSFSSEQTKFRNAYTDYMRELEALIATDCSKSPADFYSRLVTTRTRRSALETSVKKLNSLISSEAAAVKSLKETITK